MGKTIVGSVITFTTPEVAAGTYELFAEFVLANEYGIVQVFVNGEPVGEPFDAYCDKLDIEGKRVALGKVKLAGGPQRLAVKIVGQNKKSKSRTISVKRWLLKRLD